MSVIYDCLQNMLSEWQAAKNLSFIYGFPCHPTPFSVPVCYLFVYLLKENTNLLPYKPKTMFYHSTQSESANQGIMYQDALGCIQLSYIQIRATE